MFDAEETARRLPYPELADGIAKVLLQRGEIVSPERSVIDLGESTLLLMPAASRTLGVVKVVTVHPQNAAQGLPTIQGEVVVMRRPTGVRLGTLDGATVTGRRTAALSLLAAKTLAPSRGPLLVIGAGAQARAHLEAFRVGLEVQKVYITSRTRAGAEALAVHARSLGMDAHVVESPAEAVADAPLIVTATTSRTPVLTGPLRRGALVCAVGSFQPEVAEVSADIIAASRVVVDTLEAAKAEAGDLIQAAATGRWRWSQARALADVLGGPRRRHDGPTVFKSVGHAMFDLAAAHVAFGEPVA